VLQLNATTPAGGFIRKSGTSDLPTKLSDHLQAMFVLDGDIKFLTINDRLKCLWLLAKNHHEEGI